MSASPIVDRIRIIPRPGDFLDRNVGKSGEVYFNRSTDSLRVYTGQNRGGGGGNAGGGSGSGGNGGSGIVIVRYRTS